jgi:medium-chain acyl-[acyl-carrier-protein] hydrolase
MDTGKLEKEYEIHVYETGPDEKLSLYSLFDYLQDIASDHAVLLSFGRDDLLERNQFWILSRIYAEISELPEWGDRIVVKTWPSGIDKLFALRDYEVSYPDGKTIALATSSWLVLDRTTKRIQRPDHFLGQFNNEHEMDHALPRNAQKLIPAGPEGEITSRFTVKVSDLDINLHTNNARYFKWVNDSYDPDFIMNHVPVYAEINYLAESHFNEEIIIRMSGQKDKNNTSDYSIVRTADNTELCRARIVWKNTQTSKKS